MSYVEIGTLYFYFFNILYEGKERPAQTKLMAAKLRAVLANFGLPQIFRKINMWGL